MCWHSDEKSFKGTLMFLTYLGVFSLCLTLKKIDYSVLWWALLWSCLFEIMYISCLNISPNWEDFSAVIFLSRLGKIFFSYIQDDLRLLIWWLDHIPLILNTVVYISHFYLFGGNISKYLSSRLDVFSSAKFNLLLRLSITHTHTHVWLDS